MLLKGSRQQVGKFDCPRIVVLAIVIIYEDVMIEEDIPNGSEAEDDDEDGVGGEVVVDAVVVAVIAGGGVGPPDPVVVIPSNAFAQTMVPSGPAVPGTSVFPPLESKVIMSSSSLPAICEVQTAPAPGRIGSRALGASKPYVLIFFYIRQDA